MMNPFARILMPVLFVLGIVAWTGAQTPTDTEVEPEAATSSARLPGVVVHREAGYVDVQAMVVYEQDGEWVELIACSPHTLEYESLLRVEALPSHIHLGMLMLGLEAGAPLRWEMHEDHYLVFPPHGEVVELFVVVQDEQAASGVREIPANELVIHQITKEPLAENRWLFAGSRFLEPQAEGARERYAADVSGTVASLVNFGDELFTRETKLTNREDGNPYDAAHDLLPPADTPVLLRIRPTGERVIAEPVRLPMATATDAP